MNLNEDKLSNCVQIPTMELLHFHKGSFTYYVRFLGGGGVWDFVTGQTKKKFFLGKFVTRVGEGSKISVFCVTK